MFTILVTSFLFIGLIYSIVVKFRNTEEYYSDKLLGVIITLSVVLIIWFIVWIAVYTSSMKEIARIDAFYRHTKGAYEHSITATEEIEIKTLKKIEESKNSPMQMFDSGGFAYFQLAPVAGERIMEFRNKVEWYNAILELYERWNHFWFTDGFVVDVPSDLKPIMFSK